jgi:large subunit ribosomal protein L13
VLTKKEQPSTFVDASGMILGRMSSIVAKRLLAGESIVILNAEKAIISGKRLSRVKEARAFLEKGHHRKGPFHPRRPDQIVRRAIRGMLPRRLPKGQLAFRRLKVFLGVPSEFKNVTFQTIPEADVNKLKCPYVTVGEYAKEIGYSAVGE